MAPATSVNFVKLLLQQQLQQHQLVQQQRVVQNRPTLQQTYQHPVISATVNNVVNVGWKSPYSTAALVQNTQATIPLSTTSVICGQGEGITKPEASKAVVMNTQAAKPPATIHDSADQGRTTRPLAQSNTIQPMSQQKAQLDRESSYSVSDSSESSSGSSSGSEGEGEDIQKEVRTSGVKAKKRKRVCGTDTDQLKDENRKLSRKVELMGKERIRNIAAVKTSEAKARERQRANGTENNRLKQENERLSCKVELLEKECSLLKTKFREDPPNKKRRRNNETREKVLAISLWGTNNNEEETNVMKMSICDNCEKDGDDMRYNIIKMKTDRISCFVTDMTPIGRHDTTFKMKRSTPLKKLKDAYAENYNIREDEKQHCRFLYDGKRINDDDTPFSLGMDDGDTIELFWAPNFNFRQRKKNLESEDRRELELE